MKKKYTLFRADGDVISTADFQGEAGKKKLSSINTLVLSARVTQKSSRQAAVKLSTSKDKASLLKDAVGRLASLLPADWLKNTGYSLSTTGASDYEIFVRFKDGPSCLLFVNRLKACKALAAKVAKNDTSTVDPRYSGKGAELSCTVGNATVKFMRPFDQAAFEAQQQHTLQKASTDSKVAAVQVQQAEAQQQQAEADLKTEEARSATATGRTLRIVGLAALAALVIGVVVVVIVKTRKK